jgi:hypothetical protein
MLSPSRLTSTPSVPSRRGLDPDARSGRARRVRAAALTIAIACLAGTLLSSTVALAAPITVNLRIEGSTKTLYEGPVSTEAVEIPGFETKSSGGSHPCDVKDNGENGGFGAAGATPTVALRNAALASDLTFDATWFPSINDFDVSQVGEDVANSGENGEYWGYAVNFTTAELGGCQIRLAPGSEVLWAYNFFGLSHLLSLSGPATANLGTPFTVHVTDGQTGQPVAGAAVGQLVGGVTTTTASSPTTDANGNATVVLTQGGSETLKATQSESVRSNGLTICVHSGNDGTCGTTLQHGSEVPPLIAKSLPIVFIAVPRVDGVKNGHSYSRRSAPRILTGSIGALAGEPLREVRLSLTRTRKGHCSAFNGRSAVFKRASCHTAHFFKVADTSSFSYLLPSRLPAGQYVYVIEAVSDSGLITTPANGVSRVVFDVK